MTDSPSSSPITTEHIFTQVETARTLCRNVRPRHSRRAGSDSLLMVNDPNCEHTRRRSSGLARQNAQIYAQVPLVLESSTTLQPIQTTGLSNNEVSNNPAPNSNNEQPTVAASPISE